MRIATWNINGIKARLDVLLDWLESAKPDIACLQEIKSVDEAFPRHEIEALGYHIETHGQKSFNGVALLSKKMPDEVLRGLPVFDGIEQFPKTASHFSDKGCGDKKKPEQFVEASSKTKTALGEEDSQARYIEAIYSTKTGIIRVASLYLPNGNPVMVEKGDGQRISDKYAYKLDWMARLAHHARSRLEFEEPFILAGDYNVIPAPLDAAKPELWQQDALYLPQTLQKFREILSLGFCDALRLVSDEALFSFWDYQGGAWQKNNGIRIDHLLLSPQAVDVSRGVAIERELRGREKPSDHVPVWLDIDLEFS